MLETPAGDVIDKEGGNGAPVVGPSDGKPPGLPG